MARSKLLALDPGDTTGWAAFWMDDETFDCEGSGNIHGGVFGFVDWWHDFAIPVINTAGPLTVVSEKFIVRPGFVGDSEALKIEGALAALHGKNVRYQMPSQKATLFPKRTEAQRFRGLREMSYEGTSHELDAITHALLYLKGRGNRGVLSLYKKGDT